MSRVLFCMLVGTACLLCPTPLNATLITLAGNDSLSYDTVIDFDWIPISERDYMRVFPGIKFGERFAGQSLSRGGEWDNFDILTGTPTGPLTLLPGEAGQNLNLHRRATNWIMVGQGPPPLGAAPGTPGDLGEGAISFMFDAPQREFGLDIRGASYGTTEFQFYRLDGSRIDELLLLDLKDETLTFERAGDVADISGVTITNTDLAGLGIDNLRFTSPAGQQIPSVPEPASLLLLGIGAFGLTGFEVLRRRHVPRLIPQQGPPADMS